MIEDILNISKDKYDMQSNTKGMLGLIISGKTEIEMFRAAEEFTQGASFNRQKGLECAATLPEIIRMRSLARYQLPLDEIIHRRIHSKPYSRTPEIPKDILPRRDRMYPALWKYEMCGLSEECTGTSPAGNPLVVITHGAGILSASRRLQDSSKDIEFTPTHAMRVQSREFHDLLEGKLPDGSSIPMMSYVDFRIETSRPRKYGIIMDLETANSEAARKKYQRKNTTFEDTPLVIARAGGSKEAEKYAIAWADLYGKLPLWNTHNLERDMADPRECQARMLVAGRKTDNCIYSTYHIGNQEQRSTEMNILSLLVFAQTSLALHYINEAMQNGKKEGPGGNFAAA